MRIIFATSNEHKIKEIKMILRDLKLPILTMKEAGLEVEVIEDGRTFEENAEKKAREIAGHAREKGIKDAVILADDSGLEIDALNGEPGVYSARYLGTDTSYEIKNKELISRLNGVPEEKRTARFVCVIAAVFPNGKVSVVRGTIEGRIAYDAKGENGFGYDPIFYVPELGMTTGELTDEGKNAISHRGKALRAMKEEILHVI